MRSPISAVSVDAFPSTTTLRVLNANDVLSRIAVIPMGTPTTSVGEYITECQRVLEDMKDEGIRYEVQ